MMRFFKLFSFLILILCISIGTMVGCDDSIFGPGGEIRCGQAIDDEDAFCGRGTNPGVCCYRDPCAFFSMSTCSFCDDDLSPCCGKGEKLCSIVDICIDSDDQCPDSDQPLVSEFITFNVREVGELDCFLPPTLYLSGVVIGPVGSEWTVSIPERPELSLEFAVTLFCNSWTFMEGRCIRMEGDPVASDWDVSIDILDLFERPTPEVDFRIFTQDDSRTVTHMSCPAF